LVSDDSSDDLIISSEDSRPIIDELDKWENYEKPEKITKAETEAAEITKFHERADCTTEMRRTRKKKKIERFKSEEKSKKIENGQDSELEKTEPQKKI